MGVTRLDMRRVEKPWGRRDLPAAFGAVPEGGEPVGEIWFEDARGGDPELLVKYLFTSERLSIQVHPDDARARATGHKRGKDEAWIVLATEPGATIGIGLTHAITRDALRAAACDGSIEAMLDWKPARAGDVYYSRAGTVHALGPGLTLIEVQQNLDLTYRLYDYGRPRELHLDAGVAASDPMPYAAPFEPYALLPGREILAEGLAFILERWTRAASGTLEADGARPVWIVPVAGGGTIGRQRFEPGGVWLADAEAQIVIDEGSDLLLAYPGAALREALIR